jgi:hypothetical protein
MMRGVIIASIACVVCATLEHTTSSVDMQVCVSDVLSNERDALQSAVLSALNTALSTDNAVYPLRRYTTLDGVCFICVYHAQSPSAARGSILQLDSVKTIDFNGDILEARITAVPWRGEELPLGAPSMDELMLWFIVSIILLFSCILGMCCFVAIRRTTALSDHKSFHIAVSRFKA